MLWSCVNATLRLPPVRRECDTSRCRRPTAETIAGVVYRILSYTEAQQLSNFFFKQCIDVQDFIQIRTQTLYKSKALLVYLISTSTQFCIASYRTGWTLKWDRPIKPSTCKEFVAVSELNLEHLCTVLKKKLLGMVLFPVHQVWPKPSCKAQWKGEEDKADKGRGGKTTSGNGQAWSSASPRGQWRKGKNGENWLRNHLWCPNDPRG